MEASEDQEKATGQRWDVNRLSTFLMPKPIVLQAFLLRPDTQQAAGGIQECFICSLWGQKQDFPVAKVTPARGPGASVLGAGFQSGFVLPCHLLG